MKKATITTTQLLLFAMRTDVEKLTSKKDFAQLVACFNGLAKRNGVAEVKRKEHHFRRAVT